MSYFTALEKPVLVVVKFMTVYTFQNYTVVIQFIHTYNTFSRHGALQKCFNFLYQNLDSSNHHQIKKVIYTCILKEEINIVKQNKRGNSMRIISILTVLSSL